MRERHVLNPNGSEVPKPIEPVPQPELSAEELEAIGLVLPKGSMGKRTRACSLLCAAVLGAITVGKGSSAESRRAPAPSGGMRPSDRAHPHREAHPSHLVERAELPPLQIEAQGMQEFIGMSDEAFATSIREVFGPFLKNGAYHFVHSSRPQIAGPAYFGIQPPHHAHQGRERRGHENERWVVLASHQFHSPQKHEVVLRDASLQEAMEGCRSIPRFWRTVFHEVIHGLGQEGMGYFEGRVRARQRIPFPYTERFRAVRSGETPDYAHMADEYRSKVYEVIFDLDSIPSNTTVEDAAVQSVRQQFPQVEEHVAREDIRAALARLPTDADWRRVIEGFRNLVLQSGVGYERTRIERMVIAPIPDESVRAILERILHQRLPTTGQRVFWSSPDRVAPEQLSSLTQLQEGVQEYGVEVLRQREGALQASHPALVPVVRAWHALLETVSTRSGYHLAFTGALRRVVTDPHPYDYFSLFNEREMTEQARTFREGWNRLSEAERASLRPELEVVAGIVSHTASLPSMFVEQAEALGI